MKRFNKRILIRIIKKILKIFKPIFTLVSNLCYKIFNLIGKISKWILIMIIEPLLLGTAYAVGSYYIEYFLKLKFGITINISPVMPSNSSGSGINNTNIIIMTVGSYIVTGWYNFSNKYITIKNRAINNILNRPIRENFNVSKPLNVKGINQNRLRKNK